MDSCSIVKEICKECMYLRYHMNSSTKESDLYCNVIEELETGEVGPDEVMDIPEWCPAIDKSLPRTII